MVNKANPPDQPKAVYGRPASGHQYYYVLLLLLCVLNVRFCTLNITVQIILHLSALITNSTDLLVQLLLTSYIDHLQCLY